jgi:hypothetical protein
MEKSGKIAPPVHDALDTNEPAGNAIEDDVAADDRQACLLADFRAKLVEERLFRDGSDLLADLAKEGDSASRIVLGDEVCDGFQVGLDKPGKLDAH